jgi:hypothetical protein
MKICVCYNTTKNFTSFIPATVKHKNSEDKLEVGRLLLALQPKTNSRISM